MLSQSIQSWCFSIRLKIEIILRYEVDFYESNFDLASRILFPAELGYYEAGEYKAALASFDQALRIQPNFYAVWNNRGLYAIFLTAFEQVLTIQRRRG